MLTFTELSHLLTYFNFLYEIKGKNTKNILFGHYCHVKIENRRDSHSYYI
jgi:hypothetical protein